MKKRRLALGAFTFASCSPAVRVTDAGLDAGTADGGVRYLPDGGVQCYR